MKRIGVFFVSLGLWAFLALAGNVLAAEDPLAAAGILKAKIKMDAPAFVLEDLSGRKVSLQDYRGKIVLLSFWATW